MERRFKKFIEAAEGTIHHVWDNTLEPIAHVSPGDELAIECIDASGGQLSPGSRAGDLLELDFDRINPVTGPVYVEGAGPGDVLEVEILELEQPQFRSGHLASPAGTAGYYATVGIGDELMEATKRATRYMIEHLSGQGLSREDAYMLCSIVGELRISQVVDRPNWTVTMCMPQGIFRQ